MLAGELKDILSRVPDYAEIRVQIVLIDDEGGSYSEDRPTDGIETYDGGSILRLLA